MLLVKLRRTDSDKPGAIGRIQGALEEIEAILSIAQGEEEE